MDRRMDAKRSTGRKTPAVNGFLAYSTVIEVFTSALKQNYFTSCAAIFFLIVRIEFSHKDVTVFHH